MNLKIVISMVLMALAVVQSRAAVSADATGTPDTTQAPIELPAMVRSARVYGGTTQTLPPVLLVNTRYANIIPVYGESRLTLEVDVQAAVPPLYRVSIVHCRADWVEDNNVFLNDIIFAHSSNFNWQPAPPSSRYYTYRGTMSIPNETIRVPYGGNWKVRITDYDNDSLVLGEARFFALDLAVQASLEVGADFYEPNKKVSPSALSLDCSIDATQLLSDMLLHSAVFYRLNRWNEPFVVSNAANLSFPKNPRFSITGTMQGVAGAGKRFHIHPIPAENDYRVLDLTNLALYPHSSTPIRPLISDLPRYGSAFVMGDDGAMVTGGISSLDDDYVPVEFVLDPENRPTDEEVFVVGSFNNWKASPEWQMMYNTAQRQYTLRHWIRRARHNYYYGTGHINANTREVYDMSYEDFEGNNVGAGMTFVCFLYYRDPSFGGYDTIVGVCAASIFGPKRR